MHLGHGRGIVPRGLCRGPGTVRLMTDSTGSVDPNVKELKMTGGELQQMREELGWTQRFLAEKLGVTRCSIAHWEQGRAPVPSNISAAVRRSAKSVARAFSVLRAATYV